MLFTFVLYAPKAYIHMIIKSLDENIVHETLVTKSELFCDSLHVYSRDQPRDLEHIYKRARPKCRILSTLEAVPDTTR